MKIIQQHIVTNAPNNIRLQAYGVGLFDEIPTKSAWKKAIKKGRVLVNGKQATTAHFVQKDDKIALLEKEEVLHKIYRLDLKVGYEDDYLAIIEKPSGIAVSGNKFATIANALSPHITPSSQPDAVRPFPVHRLDYPTSGCLMIGKTASVKRRLHQMFEEQRIEKVYRAVCVGQMEKTEGVINQSLEGKKAKTNYKVLETLISERFEVLNLVELYPTTGRKHQLRQHLFHIGNPIMGDQKYFLKDKKHQGYGLYLHALSLKFKHPITQEELLISSEMPKKFTRLFPKFK